MKALILGPNFHRSCALPLRDNEASDRFYDMLIEAHRNLGEKESHAFNARLILVLANHIGDLEVLGQAIEVAGNCTAPDET